MQQPVETAQPMQQPADPNEVSGKSVELAARVSRAFHVPIEFTNETRLDGVAFPGAYRNGRIILNRSATQGDVLRRTLVHELVHRAEASGDAYTAAADAILDAAYNGNQEQLQADLSSVTATYPVAIVVKSTDENLGEVTQVEAFNGIDKRYVYSLNAVEHTKKETGYDGLATTQRDSTSTGSTISISNLLELVKDDFGDGFSQDVLEHLGMTRPIGDFANGAKFSLLPSTDVLSGQIAAHQASLAASGQEQLRHNYMRHPVGISQPLQQPTHILHPDGAANENKTRQVSGYSQKK